MEYAESILDLVGSTPLVRLTKMTRELGPTARQPLILAKLEALNPGGSVKDRIGLPMIEAAERAGLLKPGGTIIEPTSGNTGHAWPSPLVEGLSLHLRHGRQAVAREAGAAACLRGGGRAVSDQRRARIAARATTSVARRLARDIPGAFQPDQYSNEENPRAHERTTGPEIWRQTDGRITHLVVARQRHGRHGSAASATTCVNKKIPTSRSSAPTPKAAFCLVTRPGRI